MQLIDLIESISKPDETGLLTIKLLQNFEVNSLNSVEINTVESANEKYNGPIHFGDDTWRESSSESISFKGLKPNFMYEVKSAALLATHSGLFEGGDGQKFGTTVRQIRPLIKFAKQLQSLNVDSFASFNLLPPLIRRNHFVDFITKELDLESGETLASPRFFGIHTNYGLFSEDSLDIFWEEIDKLGITIERSHPAKSYPIIPSGILKEIIKDCERRLKEAKEQISNWEAVNNEFIDAIGNSFIVNVENNTSSIVRQAVGESFNDRLRAGFSAFNNLKLNVLTYILTYTGMRREEALSCTLGCATKKDGRYYVEAVLTKTDEGEIKLKWVANKDTYDAIKLLERYIKGMHKRAKVILENHSDILTSGLKHRLQHGLDKKLIFGVADYLTSINFTESKLGQTSSNPEKDPKFSLHKFEYRLSAEDIDQLEALDCNYKPVRGKYKGVKYIEGEVYHISPHMFRHNFAWFIIANRLGELDDIKHQFKHLASSMTMVYATRGYQSMDEMINMFEDFEELLVETIASELAEEAEEGNLSGAGGERLNKGAKSLVFDVDASGESNTGRTIKQIHFKDLNSYKEFLVQNLKNIRGLPHGYCTGGAECKLKNVGLPSGCVYCPSYTVTEKQKVHWRAMKNQANSMLTRFTSLSPSEQEEHSLMAESWRNTVNAAKVILTDSKPFVVDDEAIA
ncbi:tyrosine-type recombinase/integrase [Alteromonas sp. 5E99-2]|uniref:tyrosine-type recombinase/integrase n=1 Tax=Alteromonas sp. 5E99-2 TaxID=2817683 RepID=UPI001A990CB0|nr:tyrosine-type recombinase/integrase [Alteromonas sp. 5E99-2]MBO1256648.1 tyrosine-type recombinase/integrase [Alteromonas sp. 5E99-2]